MKIKLLFSLTICILIMTSACKQSKIIDSYTINGTLTGLEDGTKLKLVPMGHYDVKPVGETTLKDGKFTFTGKQEEPICVYLRAGEGYGYYPFILINGVYDINGKCTMSSDKGASKYNFHEMTITNSPLTEQYNQFMSVRDTLDLLYAETHPAEFNDINQKLRDALSAGNTILADSIKKIQENLTKEEKRFFDTVEKKYTKLFIDNRNTFWAPLLMTNLMSYFNESQKPIYDTLSDEAKNSYYGKLVKEELYPKGLVGEKITDFTVKNDNNEDVTLSKLLEGKKYLLIDFWASWCNPCRKEIPNLKEIYEKYSAKGFEIVSVSIDKKESDWKKALVEEQLKWPNFRDVTDVAAIYKIKAVPTMYLIDANGICVAENIRGKELANKIAELLK